MMATELLEIQPRELKFKFELMKQSSCSVQLVNKSNQYVAFKVKTTSPKKYCVRPNIGVLDPKSTCEFTVTMQAQKLAPPDMICRDKFLVQCAVVPEGTTDDDISSSMFAKEDGKYVEESKLRVIFVSPPHSPVLSPINGTLKQVPAFEDSMLKDQVNRKLESLSPQYMVTEDVENNLEKPHLRNNIEKHQTEDNVKVQEDKHVAPETVEDAEKLTLVKDIDEMKLKLNELESKLQQAEVAISKLTEERRVTIQEKEILQQELAMSRSTKVIRKVQVGFPLLFVCMVALVSVVLGYLLHR